MNQPPPFFLGQRLDSRKNGRTYVITKICWNHWELRGASDPEPDISYIRVIEVYTGETINLYYPAALRAYEQGELICSLFGASKDVGFPENTTHEEMEWHGYAPKSIVTRSRSIWQRCRNSVLIPYL